MTDRSDLPIVEELGETLFARARQLEGTRRGVTRYAVAAAALAATVLLLAVALGTSTEESLSQQAYAAVADGPGARHLVFTELAVEGGAATPLQRSEMWLADGGCRTRTRYERPPGRLAGDVSETARAAQRYDARHNSVTTVLKTPRSAWVTGSPRSIWCTKSAVAPRAVNAASIASAVAARAATTLVPNASVMWARNGPSSPGRSVTPAAMA